ncbi:chitinase-3-like protein 1 [Haemaphysalis longicornis]
MCYLTLPYYFNLTNETAYLCTHLIVGFVKTLENGTLTMVRTSDLNQYKALLKLRNCNPELKVLVTTGINNHNNNNGSSKFSQLVNTTDGRRNFVNSSVTFVREHGFDGLDVDWEYPGHYLNNPVTKNASEDKENYVLLLQELQAAFTNNSDPGYCKDLLLSVAVSATKRHIDDGFDIYNISQYVDYMNLMCYNYHVFQDHRKYTRHSSPLFINEKELNSSLIPKEDRELFATAYVVCEFLNTSGTKSMYVEEIEAPYAYNGTYWVAYNDERAITAKV